MRIPSQRVWRTLATVFTILFVLWMISFFVDSGVQGRILEWTHDYGYWFIFVWVVAANIIAGLPSSFMPIGLGLAAAKGDFNPVISIIVLTLASVVGDVTAYALSRRFRLHFLRLLGIDQTDKNYVKAVAYLQRGGGGRVVFLTRFFLAGILGFINYAAGMLKMPFRSFITVVILGEAVWSILWFTVGYYPLAIRHSIANHKMLFITLGVLVVLALLTSYVILRRRKKKLHVVLLNLLLGHADT